MLVNTSGDTSFEGGRNSTDRRTAEELQAPHELPGTTTHSAKRLWLSLYLLKDMFLKCEG
jgi:hypothetical protein